MRAVALAKILAGFVPVVVAPPLILASLPTTLGPAAFRAAFLALESLAMLAYAMALNWPVHPTMGDVRRIAWLAPPVFLLAGVAAPGATSSAPDVLTMTLFLLVSPIAEELVFRGWMYRQVQQGGPGLSVYGLVAITALFAASHFSANGVYLLVLVGLGAGLHLVRHSGRSVWLAVLCHVCFNAGALIR